MVFCTAAEGGLSVPLRDVNVDLDLALALAAPIDSADRCLSFGAKVLSALRRRLPQHPQEVMISQLTDARAGSRELREGGRLYEPFEMRFTAAR